MRKSHIAASLLSGVSVFALASMAYAQDASESVDEIVVTGSRIVQNGNNMPTPVTVVSTEQLTATNPSNIQDAIQSLPVFSGAQDGPQRQPGNSSGNGAGHTLNLRSIGNTRTLVLYDGKRVPPTTPNGEVNVDIIPSMLIQRVDVVTGGASAVYGSDAVAGVVNYVTDRNFSGLKFDAMHGRSQLNDGEETKIGIAGGRDVLNGRGHVLGSFEYYNSPGIFSKLNREFGRNVWTMQGAGTTANPYRLVKDTRLNATSFMGNFTNVAGNGALRDMVFRQNGVLDRFQHGTPTGSATVESGGDGGYFYNASLLSMLKSKQFYGRFDYDLTDNVSFYIQGTASRQHNRNGHETNEVRNLRISPTNAFLAPQYQQAALASGVTTLTFSKMMTQAPVKRPDTIVNSEMVLAGFEGNIGGNWQWEIGGILSKNRQETANLDNPNNGKLFAAMDAVRAPDGTIVCNVTLTHPGLYPGCIPINFFGPTSESAEAIDYVLDKTTYVARTKMNSISGSITGSPFSTWAGEVGVAVSAEARKLSYVNVSDAQPLPLDCTGLRFNCTQGSTLRFQSNVLGDRTLVTQTVKEAAGEVNVPLLADQSFAQSFILNGAVRYTDYDTSGSVVTWKIGADWDVNDQIKFRATRSRDIRAPNLRELFAPRLINPAGVTDLLTGIVGQAPFNTDSNPNLDVEVAKTWTAGVVLRPSFIPRFSLAVDWYKIDIGNAIATIQGQNPTIQGICNASGGTHEFCALIERPFPVSNRTPANFVTAFYSRPVNAQVLTTNGVDVEANWNTEFLSGTLSLRGLASYQPTLQTIAFPSAPEEDSAGGPGQSKLRIVAFAKYTVGPYSIDIQQRWRSKQWYNSNRALVYDAPGIPSDTWTNLTLGYRMGDANFYLSIKNLFNNKPTPYGNIGGSSGVPGLFGGYPPGDDQLGRFFNIGVRYRR